MAKDWHGIRHQATMGYNIIKHIVFLIPLA